MGEHMQSGEGAFLLNPRPKDHYPKWVFVDSDNPDAGAQKVTRDEYHRRAAELISRVPGIPPEVREPLVQEVGDALENVYDETRVETVEDIRWNNKQLQDQGFPVGQ